MEPKLTEALEQVRMLYDELGPHNLFVMGFVTDGAGRPLLDNGFVEFGPFCQITIEGDNAYRVAELIVALSELAHTVLAKDEPAPLSPAGEAR